MALSHDFYQIGTWREYLREVPWPVGPAFALDPRRTALIVVDMTVFQCDKDAPAGVAHSLHRAGGKASEFYFDSMSRVVPTIRNLLEFSRNTAIQVIYLTLGPYLSTEREMPYFLRSQTRGFRLDGGQAEISGGYQFEVIPDLRPQPGDLVIHKLTASGFIGTSLDVVLRNLGVDTVALTGAATHACVEATARSAADLGYKVVLIEDACLTQLPLWHDVTMMNCIHFNWGRVLDSPQFIDELLECKAGR
jgi:nicotinamidase-related amidase